MTEPIEPNSPVDLMTIVEGIHHTLGMAVLQEPVGSRLLDGSFDLDTYIRLLKQTYHYVRRTAPWLTRAAARTTNVSLCSLLARKAEEETGHEQWALADLAALGVDIGEPEHWPICRAVEAYIAWHDFAIEEIRPEAVLGAAYILERLSEEHASVLARRLAERGLGSKASLFMRSHGEADIEHVCALQQALASIEDAEIRIQICLSAQITASAYLGLLRSVAA